MKKIIEAKDYFGYSANFEIIWETYFIICTFAVGVHTDRRDELSIFRVTHLNGKDVYTCLNAGSLDVYQVKKEMKEVITQILMARLKAGTMTMEQITNLLESH